MAPFSVSLAFFKPSAVALITINSYSFMAFSRTSICLWQLLSTWLLSVWMNWSTEMSNMVTSLTKGREITGFQTPPGRWGKGKPEIDRLSSGAGTGRGGNWKAPWYADRANVTLLANADKKIEELDTRRQKIAKAIADLSVETISQRQIDLLSDYLDDWENISFEDRRKATDGLISSISTISEYVKTEWKIWLFHSAYLKHFFISFAAPCTLMFGLHNVDCIDI